MNGVRQRNVFGREGYACRVSFKLLTGKEVERLKTWPLHGNPRQGVSVLCRAGIGKKYISGLLAKDRSTRFALVAADSETQDMVGFAMCSLYDVYHGNAKANKANVVPVRQRTVMLDLICTDEVCAGLGKAMLRALIQVSRSTFGATLMMLEATNSAAGFYALFGFRRVPDACNWPTNALLANARRSFAEQKWENYEMTDSEQGPAFRSVAAMNRGAGAVWWKHYDRHDNGTVIMSRCLRDLPASKRASLSTWSNGAAPKIGEHHRAPVKNSNSEINVSAYGQYNNALRQATEAKLREKRRKAQEQAAARKAAILAADKAAAALIVTGRTRGERARLAAKPVKAQPANKAKPSANKAKPVKANKAKPVKAKPSEPFKPRRPYTRSQARANKKAAMPRRSPRLKAARK